MSATATFKRLIKIAIPFWGQMLVALIFGALTIGSSIALMGSSSWLIARAALHPSLDKLNVAIVGVRAFGISRGVFRYLERMTAHQVTFKLLKQWRIWFYEAVEKLAPAHLNTYRQADLLTRVVSDIEILENFYIRVLAPPLIAIMVAISMFIFTLFFSPLLTLVIFVAFLIVGLGLPYLSYQVNQQTGGKLLDSRAELNQAVLDGIQGMAEGLIYGQKAEFKTRVAQASQAVQVEQRRLAYTEGFINASHMSVIGLTVAVLLAVAIPRVEPLYLAPLALAVTASFEAFLPLALAANYLSQNLVAGERLLDIIDAPLPITEPDHAKTLTTPLNLTFNKLSFRYAEGDAWALKNFDLDLPTGKKVAIVGASGAGKSTLLNLLLRFWDVEADSIHVSDADLRDYASEDVRQHIGVVTQSTYLFNTSLAENIRLAKRGMTQEDIERAAQQAHLHEFIQTLPQGYQTAVGEQGQQLSGGERQRLALARVLLKDAPLLIFDEAFSQLDPVTEQKIWQELQTIWADKSVLLITHRFIGLDVMDEIVVLQDGDTAERGTHAELLSQQGLYYQMVTQEKQILGAQ